jgi:hypothetical protein
MSDPDEEQLWSGDSLLETGAELADVDSELSVGTVIETVIYGVDAIATFASDILD